MEDERKGIFQIIFFYYYESTNVSNRYFTSNGFLITIEQLFHLTLRIFLFLSFSITEQQTKTARAGLQFPVSRFQRYLRKGKYADRIATSSAVYLTAVIEYLSAEVLELAGNAAADNKKVRILPRHLMLAIKNDAELDILLKDAFFSGAGVLPNLNPVLISKKGKGKKVNHNVDIDNDDDDDGEDNDETTVDAASQNF